ERSHVARHRAPATAHARRARSRLRHRTAEGGALWARLPRGGGGRAARGPVTDAAARPPAAARPGHSLRTLPPVKPSKKVVDVGPVLLLDVGVVVLLVGPAPGELDLLGLTVAIQMAVD